MAKYGCILLVGLLLGHYGLVNVVVCGTDGRFFFTYVLQPFLWILVAGIVWWLPRPRAAGRLRFARFLNQLALICAVFYILTQLVAGMLQGFGLSPYANTPAGIMINLIFVSTALAGSELARAFLINNLAGRRPALVVGLAALFFALTGLPLNKLLALKTGLELTKYVGNHVFPLLGEQVLTSYLAYLGGPLPAILYRGSLQVFQWFSPVLPDLSWEVKALLGTFVPLLSLVTVRGLYLTEAREVGRWAGREESVSGWVGCTVVSVLMIWFSVGIFPVYPSLILSGSMEPGIRKGDLVVVKKMAGQEAKVGDILQFRQEKIWVTHRVVDLKNRRGETLFQTKGDNNNAADQDLVQSHQVRGKVIGVIPKIGWISLVLKDAVGDIWAGPNK
ncbi:MAG: signal peptidase I [Heliobacteriaceae bacterium]|nr:signal peptidase I [Heliobacteriaceae bacterium]